MDIKWFNHQSTKFLVIWCFHSCLPPIHFIWIIALTMSTVREPNGTNKQQFLYMKVGCTLWIESMYSRCDAIRIRVIRMAGNNTRGSSLAATLEWTYGEGSYKGRFTGQCTREYSGHEHCACCTFIELRFKSKLHYLQLYIKRIHVMQSKEQS